MLRIEVVGKNGFVPSEANIDYAIKKLQKLENHFDDDTDLFARVVCKVYSTHHKVEITVSGTRKETLRSEVTEDDIYAAIDRSIDKLMKQVRRYKTKYRDKTGREAVKEVDHRLDEEELLVKDIVRHKELELEPMTKEEAIDQMELLGHDFFVYLDKTTHKTNVIYVRDDGKYAVIETKTR